MIDNEITFSSLNIVYIIYLRKQQQQQQPKTVGILFFCSRIKLLLPVVTPFALDPI